MKSAKSRNGLHLYIKGYVLSMTAGWDGMKSGGVDCAIWDQSTGENLRVLEQSDDFTCETAIQLSQVIKTLEVCGDKAPDLLAGMIRSCIGALATQGPKVS